MDTPAHPLGNPSVPHGVTILGVYSQSTPGRFFMTIHFARYLQSVLV